MEDEVAVAQDRQGLVFASSLSPTCCCRELVDLGNLQWCTVGIRADSLDASWQLDWIEVTSITTGQRWIFHHGGWLGQGGKSEVIPHPRTSQTPCARRCRGRAHSVASPALLRPL